MSVYRCRYTGTTGAATGAPGPAPVGTGPGTRQVPGPVPGPVHYVWTVTVTRVVTHVLLCYDAVLETASKQRSTARLSLLCEDRHAVIDFAVTVDFAVMTSCTVIAAVRSLLIP